MPETRTERLVRREALHQVEEAAIHLRKVRLGCEMPEESSYGAFARQHIETAEGDLIEAAAALSLCAGRAPLATGDDPGAFLRFLSVDREGHVILADSDLERIAAACLAAFKAERRS